MPLHKYGLLVGICIVVFLIGCSDKNSGGFTDTRDTLRFETGFPGNALFSGVLSPRPGSTTPLLYFADPTTAKKILFLTPSGEVVDSIPLAAAIEQVGDVFGLSVFNRDSVLLEPSGGLSAALVDHAGKVLRTLQLGSALRYHNGLQYEISVASNSFVTGHDAFFHVALIGDSLPLRKSDPEHPFDPVYHYYELRALSPFLAKLDLSKPASELSWGADSLYYKIAPGSPLTPEYSRYTCVNNQVFIYSMYSPWVFVVDPKTMKIRSKFLVRSEFGKTHVEPIQAGRGETASVQDSITIREQRGACLVAIQRDIPTGYLLVTLAHALTGEKTGHVRSYSLFVYDDSFRLIREIAIDGAEYEPYFMFNLQNGTYIKRNLGRRKEMAGVQVFDRLILNGND